MTDLQTSQQLTRDQFEALLDAYLGAIQHATWANLKATRPEYDRALNAAAEARRALTRALFT